MMRNRNYTSSDELYNIINGNLEQSSIREKHLVLASAINYYEELAGVTIEIGYDGGLPSTTKDVSQLLMRYNDILLPIKDFSNLPELYESLCNMFKQLYQTNENNNDHIENSNNHRQEYMNEREIIRKISKLDPKELEDFKMNNWSYFRIEIDANLDSHEKAYQFLLKYSYQDTLKDVGILEVHQKKISDNTNCLENHRIIYKEGIFNFPYHVNMQLLSEQLDIDYGESKKGTQLDVDSPKVI